MRNLLKNLDTGTFRGFVLWLVICIASMTTLRQWLYPKLVVFPDERAGIADYAWNIIMSASAISIDAVLLVVLSWYFLKTWKDAFGIALYVGLTHVFFPLFTFLLAYAGASTESIMPLWLANGIQSGIFALASVLIIGHCLEVHEKLGESEVEGFRPNVPVLSWAGFKLVRRPVIAVSMDALAVGPSKIAYMERYTEFYFWLSFLLIGLLVFAIVFICGGGGVLLLRRLKRKQEALGRVSAMSWKAVIAMLFTFFYFAVLPLMYLVYTFSEWAWTTNLLTMLVVTGAALLLYLKFGTTVSQIREACDEKAHLEADEAVAPAPA